MNTTDLVPLDATMTPDPRDRQIARMASLIESCRAHLAEHDEDGERRLGLVEALYDAFMTTTHDDVVARAVAALDRIGWGSEARAIRDERVRRLETIRANVARYGAPRRRAA